MIEQNGRKHPQSTPHQDRYQQPASNDLRLPPECERLKGTDNPTTEQTDKCSAGQIVAQPQRERIIGKPKLWQTDQHPSETTDPNTEQRRTGIVAQEHSLDGASDEPSDPKTNNLSDSSMVQKARHDDAIDAAEQNAKGCST